MPILGYWKTRGLAQPIRLLLTHVGEEFEDVKYEMGDGPEYSKEAWTGVKPKLADILHFPNIPYYLDGDVNITQSNAILKYIARKHGLDGSDDQQKAVVDMLLDVAMDLRNGIVSLCYDKEYENLKDGYFKNIQSSLVLYEKKLKDNAWFAGSNLAQPIRLLLNHIGEEFEDLKYEMGEGPDFSEEEWLNKKFTLGLEFPNIPYYIDGDVKITQSNAILTYLGRKYNIAGATDEERVMVDIILNHAMDVRVLIDNTTYSPKYEDLKEELFQKLNTLHFPMLEKRLEKTGKLWFLGEKMTIVDFPLYEILDNTRVMRPGVLNSFPCITTFLDRFESQPNIKRYMESDRFMRSPINNKFASFIG